MNTPLIQRVKESWNPTPVKPPNVDADLSEQNSVQRAVESLRYVILLWEHWLAPDGTMREWLRHNTCVGVWLLIPAICVMPAVGFVLWQITGWLTMLMTIFGHLIMLPILILLAFVVIRIAVALLKR